jgi:multimeric flavodoxin WrbA
VKILIINGSPRKDGNCGWMSEQLLERYKSHDCTYVSLGDLQYSNCCGCKNCKTGDGICETDDQLKPVLEKIPESDLMIIISPNYYSAISGICKTLLDRMVCFKRRGGQSQFREDQKVFFLFLQGAGNRNHGEPTVEWMKKLFSYFGLKCYGLVVPNCSADNRDAVRLKLDEVKTYINMFM